MTPEQRKEVRLWKKAEKRRAKKARRAMKLVALDGARRIRKHVEVNSDAFLQSYEWRRVRMEALKKYGARCQCCGASRADGLRMHVDHIKPRQVYPQLALDVNNLQVLCEECNHGKGNWDMTDWRDAEAKAHIDSIKSE